MGKVTSKDGTVIAYNKTGKGPALILVDGAFCFKDYGPAPKLVPLLSENFTVYSYDRRGRGESTDTLPYTVDKEIEDLESIIEKISDKPLIMGTSSGAALVLQAIAKGVKVKKVALFEPPYAVISENDCAPPKEAQDILSNLINQEKRGKAVTYFMTKMMGVPRVFVFMFRLFGRSSWKKNESVAHTLPYDIAIMGDYSVPKDVANSVDVPALVIGGEKSPRKLRNAVDAVAKSIPNSQIALLKGQNHSASMKVLAPVLIDFLNS